MSKAVLDKAYKRAITKRNQIVATAAAANREIARVNAVIAKTNAQLAKLVDEFEDLRGEVIDEATSFYDDRDIPEKYDLDETTFTEVDAVEKFEVST